MAYVSLHDKNEIEQFLRKDVYLHNYSLGDLDDFFWPYTIWFGAKLNDQIEAIALLYVGLPLPTLLALSDDIAVMAGLLSDIQHCLPYQFYAHLSPGLETILEPTHRLEPHGAYHKMALMDATQAYQQDSTGVDSLSPTDLAHIRIFYQASYPGNWFDARMLETNQYFGLRVNKQLVSVAGIHVYSPKYKVAALGNITTHPEYRNKGYASRVTARLCQSLLDENIDIGLNVRADNQAALSCYSRIGFEVVADYGEFMIYRR